MANNMAYIKHAPTHLGAGIDILNRSADALTRSAFFTPVVYGRLYRGSSGRRSLVGYVNSVQSAAFLFDINGGSSPNEPEDTTMSNNDLHEIQLCRLTLPEMIAFKAYLKTLVMLDEQGIKHIRMNTPDLISACKKAIAEIEFMQGLGGEE